jgi:hypothetical protein
LTSLLDTLDDTNVPLPGNTLAHLLTANSGTIKGFKDKPVIPVNIDTAKMFIQQYFPHPSKINSNPDPFSDEDAIAILLPIAMLDGPDRLKIMTMVLDTGCDISSRIIDSVDSYALDFLSLSELQDGTVLHVAAAPGGYVNGRVVVGSWCAA